MQRSGLDGQSLPFPDDSYDAALSTWTLCTIPDPAAALREVRRVLKPGGTLHFVEHGLAPDERVRRWQHRLEPMQKRIFGGCHLTRPVVDLLTSRRLHDHRARRLLRGRRAEVPGRRLPRHRRVPLGPGFVARLAPDVQPVEDVPLADPEVELALRSRHARDDSGHRRRGAARTWRMPVVASYSLNEPAVARARRLIDARQYVLDSDWGDVQPRADAENAFLEAHSWDEYAEWHLGLTDGAADETKARYAFVYGDFRRVHRTGLIACVYRAAEWRHKDVELAAHELLQRLDGTSGS